MDVSRPARKPKTVTMQDVAAAVNVSKQTVSAVVNGKPGITEETRARVWAAVEQLGYRMDLTARSLRTGRTRTLALIVTDVSNPVAGQMATSAEETTYAERYNLILYNTHDDLARESFYIDSIIQHSVDGVVFISARDESTALEKLKVAGIPVVVIDRVPQSYHGPAVVMNNPQAGRLAAEHLLALGHTRFAHIGGPESVHIARERLAGFRSVLPDASVRHLAIEPARGWRIQDGYAALQRLLTWHTDFTALFCAGDQLAIGAMRALREVGRGVPENVSVVGVDDIDLASFLCPPLTTVSQSIGEMAALGVRLLLTMLEGQELAQSRIVIEPELVLRQSTAPPPRV